MGLLTLPWKKQARFVQSVALFCVNEQFSDELFAWIDAQAPKFAGEKEGDEYKLGDSAVHAEFTSTFEKRIEDFIAGQSYTAADFYRLLKKADDAGEETVTGFVKSLLTVFEFDVPVRLLPEHFFSDRESSFLCAVLCNFPDFSMAGSCRCAAIRASAATSSRSWPGGARR